MYIDLPGRTDIETLHSELYGGAIVRFRDLQAMRDIVDFTRDFLEKRLAPHAPIESHRAHDVQTLPRVYAAAQREFAKAGEAKRLWRALFEAVGFDPQLTAVDRLILRFLPPDPPGAERPWARSTAGVSFHRDTWGTNLYAQVNWWAPVYPLDAGRTFVLFPELFAQPLANSSADFDLPELMRRNREEPQTLKAGEMSPCLLESVAAENSCPVLIQPGEVIAFSAQHAHVAVRNQTPYTRISIDTRTLLICDHVAGRGARNVDGRARWMAPGLLRRLSDGKPLSEILGVQALQPFETPAAAPYSMPCDFKYSS